MTPDASQLDNISSYFGKDCVNVGNGACLPISHTGSVFPCPNLKLQNVLLVPAITKNLLSISKLTSYYPLSVTFINNYFYIQNQNTCKVVVTSNFLDMGDVVLPTN